jgi:hypothetical protein
MAGFLLLAGFSERSIAALPYPAKQGCLLEGNLWIGGNPAGAHQNQPKQLA